MTNLTKAECKILADFIEVNIFDDIRSDTDIDSMQWLVCMVEMYQKLCEGAKEKEEEKKPKKNEIDHGKILALAEAGWSVAKIADEMGCSMATVRNHIKGDAT